MKKRINKLFFIVLFFVFMLCISACGTDDVNSDIQQGKTDSQQYDEVVMYSSDICNMTFYGIKQGTYRYGVTKPENYEFNQISISFLVENKSNQMIGFNYNSGSKYKDNSVNLKINGLSLYNEDYWYGHPITLNSGEKQVITFYFDVTNDMANNKVTEIKQIDIEGVIHINGEKDTVRSRIINGSLETISNTKIVELDPIFEVAYS